MARGVAAGMLLVAILTGLKLALSDSIGYPTPYLLYFTAALLAGWYGGLIAGLVTSVVAILAGYLTFVRGTELASGMALLGASIAFVECAAITVITTRLRDAMLESRRRADDAKAASERVRAVVDGSGHGITMLDASGEIVFANERAAELVGLPDPRAMLHAPRATFEDRLSFFREDGTPLASEDMPSQIVLRTGEASETLMRSVVRASGAERWILVRANPVKVDGALQAVVIVFHDVTEQRKHDAELHVSREWLATALRSIGDAVITTDDRGRVRYLNPIAETLTGWGRAEAEGRALDEVFRIVDETDRKTTESPVARVLREGVIVGLANHTLLLRRDGTEISIDDSAAPIRDQDGALVGVVLVFRDVSMERRAELRASFLARAAAELTSSLDYKTTLASVARLAVPTMADWCAVDMRGATEGSRERVAVAHVDPEKIALVADIERRYPPDPHAASGVPNVLRTGQAEMLPLIPAAMLDAAARDDEHLRLIRQLALRSYVAVPIRRGERTLGVITLVMAESGRIYDDADLAMAEALGERASIAIENASLYREAERLRVEAESASRAKDEFLAMLGHELRNPLAPITTALHLMDSRAGAAFERERAVIRRQLTHVVRLVDDLLDVSRITRGKVELEQEHLDVVTVLEAAIEGARPAIEERRHELQVEVPFGLVVRGDRLRLTQIFLNLLTNAAKYTPPGGHVRVSAREEAGSVAVRVADDGIGIDAELLPHVFEVFTQGAQDASRASGGLGLGLAIVKNLASLHGGTVEARSEGRGRGAEVIVRLPRSTEPADASPAATATRAPSDTSGRDDCVMVVDDNEDAREMLAMALDATGHRVVTAGDGPKAIEIARRERPSIALLDLGLPGMDGFALVARLREMPELRGTRFVALTGYGQPGDIARTRAAGFHEHLTKPIELAVLLETLELLRREPAV